MPKKRFMTVKDVSGLMGVGYTQAYSLVKDISSTCPGAVKTEGGKLVVDVSAVLAAAGKKGLDDAADLLIRIERIEEMLGIDSEGGER